MTQLSDGERRLKQLLKEEDDKRKRALIRIIVLIFLVALIIAICIPVTSKHSICEFRFSSRSRVAFFLILFFLRLHAFKTYKVVKAN